MSAPWIASKTSATIFGTAGAAIGTIAEILIYAGDSRLGVIAPSLLGTAVLGGLVAGSLWAVAGAITGGDRRAQSLAVLTSVLACVAWVMVGGTYVDVLGAAAIFGWPLGGILGATLGRTGQHVVGAVARLSDAPPQTASFPAESANYTDLRP